jgi:hypothetical protein
MGEIVSFVDKRVANVVKQPHQIRMVILDLSEIYLVLGISLEVKVIESYIKFLMIITKFILTNFGDITNCLFHYMFDVIEAQI